MTPRTLRTIFAAILFVHAIGHIQGVLSALGLFNSESWHPKSWLFDTLLGEKASRILALILRLGISGCWVRFPGDGYIT